MSVQSRDIIIVHARTLAVWTPPARSSATANTSMWPHAGKQTCVSVAAELGNLRVSLCLSVSVQHTQAPCTCCTWNVSLIIKMWDCVYTVNLKKNMLSYEMYKTYHCQLLFHSPFHIKKIYTDKEYVFVCLFVKHFCNYSFFKLFFVKFIMCIFFIDLPVALIFQSLNLWIWISDLKMPCFNDVTCFEEHNTSIKICLVFLLSTSAYSIFVSYRDAIRT